jgi:hypothetical protein
MSFSAIVAGRTIRTFSMMLGFVSSGPARMRSLKIYFQLKGRGNSCHCPTQIYRHSIDAPLLIVGLLGPGYDQFYD